MKTFQELADEALTDLLNKHGRPTDLTMALKQTARAPAPLDRSRQPQETPPRGRGGYSARHTTVLTIPRFGLLGALSIERRAKAFVDQGRG
jgi:hypothetical protein